MAALSKFGRVATARSHDECRQVVCCVCSKKVKQKNKRSGTIKVISEKMSNLVRQYVFGGYSVQNPFHPTALCDSCRLTLCDFEKVLAFRELSQPQTYILYFRIQIRQVESCLLYLTMRTWPPLHPSQEQQWIRHASVKFVKLLEPLLIMLPLQQNIQTR